MSKSRSLRIIPRSDSDAKSKIKQNEGMDTWVIVILIRMNLSKQYFCTHLKSCILFCYTALY